MKKFFFITLLASFILSNEVFAEKTIVFDFTEEEFKTLKVKKIKGETTWTLGANENGNFIKAEAQGKGSGLGKEIKINLLKTMDAS